MTDRSESRVVQTGDASLPFDVSVKSEGRSAWVVEVRGELDIATAPILKKRLETCNASSASSGHAPSMVYVLRELGFMDCAGLRSLLTAVDGLVPEAITVRQPSRQVRRLLELVGLDAMIENDGWVSRHGYFLRRCFRSDAVECFVRRCPPRAHGFVQTLPGEPTLPLTLPE